ncbi:cwfj family protein [Cardiosporidium cionae]|uniref:Cwfj family protein n=1 Tax=Cardiosporidium cionae TaxID=476202 RepID=A0ABQ7J9P3_9APIC|nr:cwfj family protein [Cardiosporidium cionae]|eukprot:KAF8820717.1 cwfj family protein [Cardiosporidium cionae]
MLSGIRYISSSSKERREQADDVHSTSTNTSEPKNKSAKSKPVEGPEDSGSSKETRFRTQKDDGHADILPISQTLSKYRNEDTVAPNSLSPLPSAKVTSAPHRLDVIPAHLKVGDGGKQWRQRRLLRNSGNDAILGFRKRGNREYPPRPSQSPPRTDATPEMQLSERTNVSSHSQRRHEWPSTTDYEHRKSSQGFPRLGIRGEGVTTVTTGWKQSQHQKEEINEGTPLESSKASTTQKSTMDALYTKYTESQVTGEGKSPRSDQISAIAKASVMDEASLDANELNSRALRCMMGGDMEGYKRYTAAASRLTATPVTQQRDGMQRTPRMSTAVVSSLSKSPSAAFLPQERYYADDDVSIEEMRRREKQRISNVGKRFKDLDEDEDEATALERYEGKHPSSKDTSTRLLEKQRKIHNRSIASRSRECLYCIESSKFQKFQLPCLIAATSNSYLCFQSMKQCILPHHIYIAPVAHVASLTHMEDDVYEEIRNFQKSLVAFFDKQDLLPIFIETVGSYVSTEKRILGGGSHTFVDCYGIPSDRLQEAKTYFKKALLESESEWSDNKKVIEISGKRGPRGAIPRGFPYIYIDFALSGGLAHVIESGRDFPKYFGRDVIRGMLEMVSTERAFYETQHFYEAVKHFKQEFKPFDWTQYPS